MLWRHAPLRRRILSALLTWVLVMIWGVAPIVCVSDAGDASLNSLGAHSHGALSEERDEHHHDKGSCCEEAVVAKFLVVAPAKIPPVKSIVTSVARVLIVQDMLDDMPEAPALRYATGPPRSTNDRFVAYTPLAPPARDA